MICMLIVVRVIFRIVLCILLCMFVVFFFKQKTAYEMRISDWSSDVCSSDLVQVLDRRVTAAHVAVDRRVADRVLALVAGSQHQPAELVAQRHQQRAAGARLQVLLGGVWLAALERIGQRSEEHTSELQSLMRISYAVFCLKKKKTKKKIDNKQKKIHTHKKYRPIKNNVITH